MKTLGLFHVPTERLEVLFLKSFFRFLAEFPSGCLFLIDL